jgi:hypothetical protein
MIFIPGRGDQIKENDMEGLGVGANGVCTWRIREEKGPF